MHLSHHGSDFYGSLRTFGFLNHAESKALEMERVADSARTNIVDEEQSTTRSCAEHAEQEPEVNGACAV